ncbi:hypothetical protein ACFLYX_01195 [Chloroflexota bacterium]
MILSKTGWITIITGVFVIAIVSLAVIRFQQIQQQKQLDEQLTHTQANLGKIQVTDLSSNKTALETQLDEVTSQLEMLQGMFSNTIESSAVTRALFNIAEAYSLEVTEMTSSVPPEENFQGVDFSQILLTAHVEGDASNIVDFITDLNNHFSAGVIKTVNITITENLGVEKAAVDVNMTIYTYEKK